MLVKPENPITNTVIYLSYNNARLFAKFHEHNDTFRTLIKDMLAALFKNAEYSKSWE